MEDTGTLYNKAVSRIKFITSNSFSNYFQNLPVYVFHHIPKCGGTSLVYALREWFWVIKDYRPLGAKRLNINLLRKCHCVVGHFHFDGIYIHQRYPEFFASDKYRLFTFLREPLEMRISLYYFEARNGKKHAMTLEEDLLYRTNFIADSFPCNEKNYKEILDRYFFIGILERKWESLNLLANMIDKKAIQFPHFNPTSRNKEARKLNSKVIEIFKEKNHLDYCIYNYAIERLGTNDPQSVR